MQKTSNFEAWYSFYPNKKAKGDARKAYEKAEKESGMDKQEFLQMLMGAVKAQITFRRQQQGTGVFVPSWRLPATWVRSESWADEVDIRPKEKGPTIGAQCSRPNCHHQVHGERFTLCEEHECNNIKSDMWDLVRAKGKEFAVECKNTEQWRAKYRSLARSGVGGLVKKSV